MGPLWAHGLYEPPCINSFYTKMFLFVGVGGYVLGTLSFVG